MSDDLDVGCGKVRIGIDKVSSENASKELRWSDWMLFGFDINCVLHRIGCHYHTVIGFGIAKEWLIIKLGERFNWFATYDGSIAPSSNTQTVISVTV